MCRGLPHAMLVHFYNQIFMLGVKGFIFSQKGKFRILHTCKRCKNEKNEISLLKIDRGIKKASVPSGITYLYKPYKLWYRFELSVFIKKSLYRPE